MYVVKNAKRAQTIWERRRQDFAESNHFAPSELTFPFRSFVIGLVVVVLFCFGFFFFFLLQSLPQKKL